MNQREFDRYAMARALSLAAKREGFTSPNPLVGAVIVKGKKIIAEGYHKQCGLAHAEIEAIKNSSLKSFKETTLYVTLEPCTHYGRTPPCLEAIIRRKFRRAVIATPDPNPLVNGKSIRKLRKAGIRVSLGVLAQEARKLNEVFFKNMRHKAPYVVVKAAQSLDGKIATSTGHSQWITDDESRVSAKSLRDKYDCILIGVNTVIKDDPHLEGLKKIPLRVIIDPQLKIPAHSYILQRHPQQVVIFASYNNKATKRHLPASVKVFFVKEKKGWLSLKEVLAILFKMGIMSVFVEGGSETIGRFFDERLVDKVYFFIAPKIIGGKTALSSVGAEGVQRLKEAPRLKELTVTKLKHDIVISGYPCYANQSL